MILMLILILQVWAYEHFPHIAPTLIDPLTAYFPIYSRWTSSRIQSHSPGLKSITTLRFFFDSSTLTEVRFLLSFNLVKENDSLT